jgi:hypothetical protein
MAGASGGLMDSPLVPAQDVQLEAHRRTATVAKRHPTIAALSRMVDQL